MEQSLKQMLGSAGARAGVTGAERAGSSRLSTAVPGARAGHGAPLALDLPVPREPGESSAQLRHLEASPSGRRPEARRGSAWRGPALAVVPLDSPVSGRYARKPSYPLMMAAPHDQYDAPGAAACVSSPRGPFRDEFGCASSFSSECDSYCRGGGGGDGVVPGTNGDLAVEDELAQWEAGLPPQQQPQQPPMYASNTYAAPPLPAYSYAPQSQLLFSPPQQHPGGRRSSLSVNVNMAGLLSPRRAAGAAIGSPAGSPGGSHGGRDRDPPPAMMEIAGQRAEFNRPAASYRSVAPSSGKASLMRCIGKVGSAGHDGPGRCNGVAPAEFAGSPRAAAGLRASLSDREPALWMMEACTSPAVLRPRVWARELIKVGSAPTFMYPA